MAESMDGKIPIKVSRDRLLKKHLDSIETVSTRLSASLPHRQGWRLLSDVPAKLRNQEQIVSSTALLASQGIG